LKADVQSGATKKSARLLGACQSIAVANLSRSIREELLDVLELERDTFDA
jgi:hypothetical protein